MKKLYLLLLIFSVSCAPDDLIELNKNSDDKNKAKPSIEMLHFNTHEDLDRFIAEKIDREVDLLEEANRMSKEEGYNSLLYLYELNLAELDNIGLKFEDLAVVNSYDDMLHFLLNRDGELSIADKIYRINDDFVFIYTIGFENEITEFLAQYNTGSIQLENKELFQFSRNLAVYLHGSIEYLDDALGRASIIYEDYFPGNQYKLISKDFNNNFYFYSSIGASTKIKYHERYWFFGWKYRWKTVKRHNRLKSEVSWTTFPDVYSYTYTNNSINHTIECYCFSASKIYEYSTPTLFGGTVQWADNYVGPKPGSVTIHWGHEYSVSPNLQYRYIYY